MKVKASWSFLPPLQSDEREYCCWWPLHPRSRGSLPPKAPIWYRLFCYRCCLDLDLASSIIAGTRTGSLFDSAKGGIAKSSPTFMAARPGIRPIIVYVHNTPTSKTKMLLSQINCWPYPFHYVFRFDDAWQFTTTTPTRLKCILLGCSRVISVWSLLSLLSRPFHDSREIISRDTKVPLHRDSVREWVSTHAPKYLLS